MEVTWKYIELADWEIVTRLVHLITSLETERSMQSRGRFMEMASSTGKAGRREKSFTGLVSSLLVCNRETKGCLETKAGLTELQQGETMGRLVLPAPE